LPGYRGELKLCGPELTVGVNCEAASNVYVTCFNVKEREKGSGRGTTVGGQIKEIRKEGRR
jgi:hypothetical protein